MNEWSVGTNAQPHPDEAGRFEQLTEPEELLDDNIRHLPTRVIEARANVERR
jgi:hypothetical protein